MLIKGEEGAGGAELLVMEGEEKEEEVEVEKHERILSGSHQEPKYNWFKGNISTSLIKVGNKNLQLSKAEVESAFGDMCSLPGHVSRKNGEVRIPKN